MLRLGCDFCFCCEVAKRPDELAKLGALRHFYVKRPDELARSRNCQNSGYSRRPHDNATGHRVCGKRAYSAGTLSICVAVGKTTDEVITRPFSISASENTIA